MSKLDLFGKFGNTFSSGILEAKPVSTVGRKVLSPVALSERISRDTLHVRQTAFREFIAINELTSPTAIKNFLQSHVKPENLIGEGLESKVYSVGEFVLKVPHKSKGKVNFENFTAVTDNLEGRNFGQLIAQNDSGVQIARKVEGTPLHSNYSHSWVDYLFGRSKIGQDEAGVFLDNLKKAAFFPKKTLSQYVDDAAFLQKKGYEVDFTNPNNFLYDEKTGRLNILDIKRKKSEPVSAVELVKPLTDEFNFYRYYAKMTPEQRKESLGYVVTLHQRMNRMAFSRGIESQNPSYVSCLEQNMDNIDFEKDNFFDISGIN